MGSSSSADYMYACLNIYLLDENHDLNLARTHGINT